MDKNPYLTKDDVLRIRATVDAAYERDVKNLSGDTTDDWGPIEERPLVVTRDMLAEMDPYADGGLILAMQLWDHTASETHDFRVHSPFDPRDDVHVTPTPTRALRPSARPRSS